MEEDPAAIWKLTTYALAGVVITLATAIAAMAKYFAKKREEISKSYTNLMLDLNKRLDRIGDYLRDLYKRDLDVDISRTNFDFKLNGRPKKED